MTRCREWQGARTGKGYGTASLGPVKRGRRSTVLVHRWVMERYLGRPLQAGEQVLHHCDNPPCFLFDHLFVGSAADNTADMMAKGRNRCGRAGATVHADMRGRRNPAARLTEEDVVVIRERLRRGDMGITLAAEFGVSAATISAIKVGRLWPHLEEGE